MSSDIINIKGTRMGLVICVESNHDFEVVKSSLRAKIESAGSFFKGAKFTFHLDSNPLTDDETRELQEICREHGLVPDEHIEWQPNAVKNSIPPLPVKVISSPLKAPASELPTIGVNEKELSEPGLLIRRNLRSGQKIDSHGSVIVLGDVNPGSEVTAAGDIIVMGALRGIAHAGASGNDGALILASRLQPTQLRIAGVICRPPDKDSGGSRPEVARLVSGQMMIEDYITNSTKN